MSDKKLLEEGAIRRFQALANIKPIGNGMLEEAAKKPAKGEHHEEESAGKKPSVPVKEAYAQEEAIEEMDAHAAVPGKSMEEKYMEEAEGEEMEMAEPAAEEGGDEIRAALEDIKKGVDALLTKIEGASDLGFEVEDEEAGGEGEEAPEMPEMGKEESLEEAELQEKKGLPPALKKAIAAKKEKADHKGDGEEMEEEALAEELTRRVAARLVAEMKKGGGNWLSAPKAAPKPKSKGSATKGGTPFKGGKK